MATVGIGPQFFKKSLNDYRDWRWALPREAMQNSMDAPHSKNIEVWVERVGPNTLFTWGNDGDPMDEEELVGKLLTLGESGKDFQNGSVGGFGAAKLILLFSHLNYEILTGYFHVKGSGGNYTIEKREHRYPGTMTTITIEGDVQEVLLQNLKIFLCMLQWSGKTTINGQDYTERMKKGSRRREFAWGIVYTNKTITNRMVVRIHGIPMFYRYVSCCDRCVVVELKTADATVLQSNRDSLKSEYQDQLNTFIDEIIVDKSSALKEESPHYIHFDGNKLRYNREATNATIDSIINAAYATVPVSTEEKVEPIIKGCQAIIEEKPPTPVRESGKHSKLNYEFIIKNNTGMEIPIYYIPSDFSEYSVKLVRVWAQTMLKLHDLFNKKAEFSVGFLFDDASEAEHEIGAYGQVYFINPITIVKQKGCDSRSFSKRWKFNAAGKCAILADAVHEFVHGALGLKYHDEYYSSVLTSTMGVVLKEKQKFNCCFV